MPSGAKKRQQQRKKARREPQQRTPPSEAHGVTEISVEVVGPSVKMPPGAKKRKQQRKEGAAKARQNEAQAAEYDGERTSPTEAHGVAEISADVVGPSVKMPPGAKKRKQQRKEGAAKARQNEAQAAEYGGERTSPTEAHGVAEISADVVGPSVKMPPGAKKRKQQRKEGAAKARQNEAQAAEYGGERRSPTEAHGVAEISADEVGPSVKMPPGAKKRKQQRKEGAAKARQNEAQAAEYGGERTSPTEAHGVAEISADVVGPSVKMPPGGKKRKQQRKEEAAKVRQNEAQAAENGSERTSPTEAHGVAEISTEGMAPAPLNGIHSLPHETLFAIFSFLPIPDLARCATVCERWHEIVTGFTRLWKGKSYTSGRSRRESVEVCAVLRASPPPQEVTVKIGEFRVDIRYPHLFLSVRDVADLSSAMYTDLPQLGNLRRLQLELRGDCVARGGLEAATRGMRRLASLQLDCGGESCERHCQRESPLLHWGYLQGNKLSEAVARLPLLEELHLRFWKLARLDFLRRCPRLRRLCLEFSYWPNASQLSNLRHLAHLEVLDLTGCRVDADVLSSALPSLTRLDALSLSCTRGVTHLRFLQHCPQLRTLSLCGTVRLEKEAYKELCHLSNLQTLDVSFDVRVFVREVVRPCLPKLKIYSSEGN